MGEELTPETVKAAFSRVLRDLREERGLSQEKLAEIAHTERMYIYWLERGSKQPTLRTMLHLAAALGLSFSDLARRIEDQLANQGEE